MHAIFDWFKQIIPRIYSRTKDLILQPGDSWRDIKANDRTIAVLFKDYLLIVAAIPPLAKLLGWGAFNLSAYFVKAILGYGLGILIVWGFARLLFILCPRFGADVTAENAFKLSLYGFWPLFISGIFYLVTSLSFLAIIGSLYSIYLFYLGIPVLVNVPEDKLAPLRISGLVAMLLILYLYTIITGVHGYHW